MIETQGYLKGKKVFYRSNLQWEDAFEYLEIRKDKEVDKVDVQIYTDGFKGDEMPVDDVEDLKSIKDAQNWINFTMGELIKRK